jgi:NADH dehydrogenase (ubiquinone) 1 alpha subcomplex subunit 8
MREHCGKEWDTHWECLEKRNQEYFKCRRDERHLNACMFEKLVSLALFLPRFSGSKRPISLIIVSAFKGANKNNSWLAGRPDTGS